MNWSPTDEAVHRRSPRTWLDANGNPSYHDYFDFQKNVYNTKYVVSFTVNVGVVSPSPTLGGTFGDRLGSLMPAPVDWWISRDRHEMEQAARSVTASIAEVALPTMATKTANPAGSREPAD